MSNIRISRLGKGITFTDGMDWTIESSMETIRRNVCLVIRKGGEGSYKYSRVKLLSCGLVRFRCTNRKCKANVFLDVNMQEVAGFSNFPHSHMPIHPQELTLARLISQCKQKIRNDTLKDPIKVFLEEAETQAIEVEDLPEARIRALRKVLHCTRKKAKQNLQRSWNIGRNEADSSRREASVSPKKREEKGSDEAILIIDDSCDSLEPAAVDTLLYDDVVFEEPKPSSGFEDYAERAIDPLQQSPHSTPLRIREGTPQELARPELSPDKLSPSSPKPQQPVARLSSVGETSFKLSETTEKRRSIEEERIHSNSISDSVSSEVTGESGDEVTPNRICQETQTEHDEDQAFLDSVLPKMKKLASSDKAMLKAQILQLIKWKTKE